MKVLIADDSKAMRRIIAAMLREAGFRRLTIVEASDGAEALGKAVDEAPDVVISDWNMPNMTGIEFLQNLREQGVTVPFGFVTTEVSPEMRELASSSGSAFLIGKPFVPTDFVRALGDYLDQPARSRSCLLSQLEDGSFAVMMNGLPMAALPDGEGVAQFLSATLRREVAAKAAKPADERLVMAGHYVNGMKDLIGGCFCDRSLIAYGGAAFSLVPAAAAEESLAEAELDEVLVENFAEILNICSRLFGGGTGQRVTLSRIEEPGTPASPTSQAMLKNPVKRLDLDLEIAGYGRGRIALALQPA